MFLSLRPDLDTTLDPQLPGAWSESSRTERSSSRHTPYNRSRPWRSQRGSRQPHRGRYEPRNPSYKLSREELRDIANSTLDTLDDGYYFPPQADEPYNLYEKMKRTNENTAYYAPDDAEIAAWATADLGVPSEGNTRTTKILVKEYSTLVGARKLRDSVLSDPGAANKTVGVLNFASAKKPGGGFLNGAQAQEESIARVSTLYPSLITRTAKTFYSHYTDNPGNEYYNHAMLYSPGVILIRNDKGEWKAPVEVDILTSAAVNAGEVRDQVKWQAKLRARVRAAEAARARELERKRKEDERAKKRYDEKLKKAAEAARKRAKEEEQENAKRNQEKDGVDHHEDVVMADPEDESKTVEGVPDAKTDDSIKDDEKPPEEPAPPAEGQRPRAHPFSPSFEPSTPPPTFQDPLSPAEAEVADLPLEDLLAIAERDVEDEMRERIARLLFLFHKRGVQHLVLGSFGTGVFQNSVALVASIFYDLLARPEGKFYGAFETLLFAILGGETVKVFQDTFADVVAQEEGMDELELGSEPEEVQGQEVQGQEVQDGMADGQAQGEGQVNAHEQGDHDGQANHDEQQAPVDDQPKTTEQQTENDINATPRSQTEENAEDSESASDWVLVDDKDVQLQQAEGENISPNANVDPNHTETGTQT